MSDLTVERLKEAVTYDPATGIFESRYGLKKGPLGTPNQWGYIGVWVAGKSRHAHRLAWLYMYGEFPDGDIDHINGIPGDNRIENLRVVTKSQNSGNYRLSVRNKSGAKGVSKQKDGRFTAKIQVNRKRFDLGVFDTLDEAAHAYNKAAIQHWGECACLNPIGVDK